MGTLIGGLLIGVVSGVTAVYWPSATEAVIYVMMGVVLLVRPRGLLGEEGRMRWNVLSRRYLDIVVSAALLFMPFWMGAIGSYAELASRILVMGLAAMSLNFLLGFTGVLSFGHAAFSGLGPTARRWACATSGSATFLRSRSASPSARSPQLPSAR